MKREDSFHRSCHRRSHLGLFGLVCLWFVSAAGWAQETSGSESGATTTGPVEQADFEFEDVIDVRVKNVLVYVRDKKGEPVRGLSAADFVLYEEGRPMQITNFYEVAGGRRTDEAEKPEQTQLERIQSNPELDPRFVSSVPEDRRLYLTVYIDHQNIRPQNRNRVFRNLRAFLREHLGREDRVQLVTYARSVKTKREWTSDPTRIAQALFEEERHTGGRTQVDSDRRDLLREIEESQNLNILESRTRLFAEEQYNDLQFTLDGIREVIDSLGGVPGRKAILYVSDGLPLRAGEEMFEAVVDRSNQGDIEGSVDASSLRMRSFEYDASVRFRAVAAAANANGVVIHALDAAGLLGRSLRGAEMRGSGINTNIESTWNNNMQTSLMFMASETGGQFAINTNNFDRFLDNLDKDFRHYYSLGYAPPHPGNGREYRIKVEIKKKRAKGIDEIRYANSYRDKSPEKLMEEATLAGLQHRIQTNELGIRLQERDRVRRSDGTFVVHVDVLIDLGEIAILPRSEETHVAKVQIWVQARDNDGGLSEVQRQELPLQIPAADVPTIADKYYAYTLPLVMAPGDQWLSVGVRDQLGGETSVVTKSFRLAS